MKRIKKSIYLETITFVIVELLIISTVSVISQGTERYENSVITLSNKIDIKSMDYSYSQPVENMIVHTQPSSILGTPLFTGITPAISHSGFNTVIGYYSTELNNVYFSESPDFGKTWTDGIGFIWKAPPKLPDVDGCGDGRFIATMVPGYSASEGSELMKIEISDDGYKASYWTYKNSGCTKIIDVACGGYTAADPDENQWAYGGFSFIGDSSEYGSQIPFFQYPVTPNGVAWLVQIHPINGATSTSMDIDQETLYSYAAYNYNHENNMDILVFIMNFGKWDQSGGLPCHSNNWFAYINTTGNDNYIDVTASKNNIIIVSERDGAIIAYYANGIHPAFSEVTIAPNGKEPRISHTGEKKAVCEFINNGVSYSSSTENGGVTWSTPERVSAEVNIQSGDVCAHGYVYESEETIYYMPSDIKQAILEIESVSGGIGVSAVVKNIGTAAAENVDWSIVTKGTVFLGGVKSGQITLQPDEYATIKTGLILGFGTIDVNVTLGPVTKKASGELLLFFITNLS